MAGIDPGEIRHLVVLAHPSSESFNRAIADEYCATVERCGQTAVRRDLYAIDFDPRLMDCERPGNPGYRLLPAIAEELAIARDCAIVTMIYPLWFGMPPAMIKGYIDRVLGAGVDVASIKNGQPGPLTSGKRLLIISSSGTTRPWLEEHGQWLALHDAFEGYLTNVFGFASSEHLHFDAIARNCSARYIAENLGATHDKARSICAALLADRHAARMRSMVRAV
jgi:NAD(P)H dehydrogenase (quinone)